MRRLPTTVFVAIGAIALGVVTYTAFGRNDATADSTVTTSSPSTSTTPSTSTVPDIVPPTIRPHPTVQQTHAVDPGMVLSGEHVVTSAEVFADTEAATGEPSDK